MVTNSRGSLTVLLNRLARCPVAVYPFYMPNMRGKYWEQIRVPVFGIGEDWEGLYKLDVTERAHRQPTSKSWECGKKRTLKYLKQLVDEFIDEGILLTEPGFRDLEADTQRAIEESLKDAHSAHRGPLPPVVFRETDTGKFQPLLEVEGKGKEKSRTSAPTKPSGHDELSSMYAELGLTESDMESDEEVPPVVKSGAPDEGQTGPNLDAEATGATSQPQPDEIDEEFTLHAYPNIQENS
ncbi:hypothetical protein Tco_1210102 [Tanacetum coccineum]